MSEEPESKRRRLVRAPPAKSPTTRVSVGAAPSPHRVTSISSLPDAVMQYCFSFIGNGHYRYIAGSNHHFQEIYSREHESKTSLDSAVESASRARLFLEDVKEETGEDGDETLEAITQAAIVSGNVEVLEWTRTMGVEFTNSHFRVAAFLSHIRVLKWAREENLEWYGKDIMIASAAKGHIHILEWIYDSGREIPEVTADVAALSGQVSVLSWMKERNLLDANSGPHFYEFASRGGHTTVLDWVHDNGYAVCRDAMFSGAAFAEDFRATLIWARQHGIAFDEDICGYAAYFGNLPMLQWLRENDCPWDARVIHNAEDEGHDHVLEWAIANGCPTE